MKKRFLKAFSVCDLILIAMLTALAVAFKAVVKILIGFIASPLGIPGGALAGGLYMLWMPLALGIVGKRGAAFLLALIQSVLVFVTGMPGSHGIWTFLTYIAPAAAVEIVFLFSLRDKNGDRRGKYNVIHFIAACLLANLAGTLASNYLFFQLTNMPILIFMYSSSAFSGAVGGVLGFLVYKSIDNSGLLGKLSGETVQETDDAQILSADTASPLNEMMNKAEREQ